TGWNSRYTFSGKEKDEETGYSYFGARYYDSDLSIWLSVDPMAGKYPHQSNYVYCSNNPIKLVDPDGREVDVTDLAKTDQDNLTKSLSELTGLNVTTTERDGKTFLSYETKDGEPTGSEDARNQLTSIIDNKDQVINVQNSDKTDIGSYAQGNTINLDSKQIQTMMDNMQGGLNPETMGYGMSFLHESFHTKLGGNLDETPTISRMNTIRGQLGTDYGSRISHEFIDMGNIFYLGFGNGRSIEIPKEKYTWKIK
ncbi:RHS repeat-associated core domain-containing protein, partial [Bacteroidales bacterium OttesenSCG-928-E04]|nr:RHS repeat-associated core domain-containing protein [Bacteroidales bacterium OttesenSCG-928-E04]